MRLSSLLFVLLFTLLALSSCGAVETIFKAGMWWAFFLVSLVVVVIILVAAKMRK
jgi:hypothetical protein